MMKNMQFNSEANPHSPRCHKYFKYKRDASNVFSSTAENSPQQMQNMLLFEECLIKPTMLICSSKRSKLFTAREGKSQHLLTCGQINDGFWYFMGVVDSKMKPLPSVVTDAQ